MRVSRHGDSILREIKGVVPDKKDSTLLWNTQISYLMDTDGKVFEISLAMSAAEFSIFPATFEIGTPRIVRDLVRKGSAYLGDANLLNQSYLLNSRNISDLFSLLTSDLRRFPVIVVSPDPETENPLIDCQKLAEQVSGLAVVVNVAADTTNDLCDMLGREFGCYHGAVRVYWPGFTPGSDAGRHPLHLPRAIQQHRTPEKFVRFLSRQIYGIAAYRYVENERIRRFRLNAEREAAEIALVRNRDTHNFEGLFKEYSNLDAAHAALREEFEALKNENANLKANQVALISTLDRNDQDDEENEFPEPDTSPAPEYRSVRDAVLDAKKNFPHLLFLDDAVGSASTSPYKQPNRVYKVLKVIAGAAEKWAEGGGVRLLWREYFQEKGFELKGNVSNTSLGKWREEYEHLYNGTKRIFKDHVTLGRNVTRKMYQYSLLP